MSRLTYEEICQMDYKGQICGYIRDPKRADDGHIYGICAITGGKCKENKLEETCKRIEKLKRE